MELTTFIKVNRNILRWGWFKDGDTFRVFMYLLLTANYEDSYYMGHKILRGQVVTGRKKIADDLAITEQRVRTAIKHLKSTNEITTKTTPKFTIVTVTGYDKYQSINQVTNQQLTNNQPTTNQQLTTSKEIKKLRNKEINKYSRETYQEIIDYLNAKAGTSYKATAKLTQEHINARLNDGFTVADFKKAIDNKCNEWKGTEWAKFLRPQTLFGTKFESYLNQQTHKSTNKGSTSYDIEQYEDYSPFDEE